MRLAKLDLIALVVSKSTALSAASIKEKNNCVACNAFPTIGRAGGRRGRALRRSGRSSCHRSVT